MKKFGLLALLMIGGVASASRDDDQAFFAILAETKLMRVVGMPPLPDNLPELPAGIKIPGGLTMPGKPSRTLNVRLWSPSIAPDSATASLAVPAGLKQGDKLDLELYRPTAEENSGQGAAGGPGGAPPDFTIKIYWGSSATVKPDQPKVIHIGDLTREQMGYMAKRAQESNPMRQGKTSYFYKPNWTTGYWPSDKQPGTIAKDASLAGSYALTTNYTGNVAIDVPSNVDFLAPIDITAPDLANKVNLDGAIGFKWGAIANCLGQNASIMGMVGKNTMIIWNSSEVYTQGLLADMSYLQMADVRDRVASHEFMPPSQTDATAPAGIFKDADFVMMNMIAYGPGAALDKAQPLPRVQTKSTLNVMLGGKAMKGGFGGGR